MDTPNAVPNQVIEPSKKEKKNSWLIYFLMFIIILLVAAVSAAVTYIVIKDSEDNTSEETQENSSTEENTDDEADNSTSEDEEDADAVSDERALRVYFQKFPEATDDYSFVDAVFRTTTRADDTIFVLEEFLKGPTMVEQTAGFKGIDPVTLSGSSNCSGKDFKLDINGTTATFQFCKTTSGLNDNTSQVSVPISENVKFYNPQVEKVIILDKDGNCFNDLSGMNACLN